MKNKRTNLVFVHDALTDNNSWKWLNKRLAKSFNCIYLELPGFGNDLKLDDLSIRSYSEWVADEIRKLNVKNYVLVGHGMGGKLALFSAFILHDLLPSKLILLSPSSPKSSKIDDSLKNLLLNTNNKISKQTLKFFVRKKVSRKRLNSILDSQKQQSKIAREWWVKKGSMEDITWAVKNLEIPTYVIHGKSNKVIPLKDVEEEVLPYVYKSKLIVLGRTGHLIQLESPRKLGKLFKRILKKSA